MIGLIPEAIQGPPHGNQRNAPPAASHMTDTPCTMTNLAVLTRSKPPRSHTSPGGETAHSSHHHARPRRQYGCDSPSGPECGGAGEARLGCVCQFCGSRQCARGGFGFDVRRPDTDIEPGGTRPRTDRARTELRMPLQKSSLRSSQTWSCRLSLCCRS